MRIVFLYLKSFSLTGGIEKFNRNFMMALHQDSPEVSVISSYDKSTDEKYFPSARFTGCGGSKFIFVCIALWRALKCDTLIIGHVNLSIVGHIARRLKPSLKLVLIVHGIEAWNEFKGFKRKVLQECDSILSVSDFTKNKLIANNSKIDARKIKIFPNAIDPYFKLPTTFDKPDYLLERYGLKRDTSVLLTITRLSSTEKYKGYDNVIKALAGLNPQNKNLKYLLCGQSDAEEEKRICELIEQEGLQDCVLLPGYVNEDELVDHYLLSDVFVMPSRKEGFGIVFIEALACGRPVIAGSKDGSADALLHGKLGKLIDPESLTELISAIGESLAKKDADPLMLQAKVLAAYRFQNYKEKLREYLLSV
ncbi:MAG TPA: glycosyltransferase family 4 protein [Cyclobacteriaceae bacterium]|nr:glycosyltransferase family 4 protein [Cyclobacteriaceae bacterium]